jgi:hypothetical protein
MFSLAIFYFCLASAKKLCRLNEVLLNVCFGDWATPRKHQAGLFLRPHLSLLGIFAFHGNLTYIRTEYLLELEAIQ